MAGSRTGRSEAPFQIAQLDGADASDLFVHAAPAPAAKDDRAQFQSMAANALEGLNALGVVPADVVAGWVYPRAQPSWCVRQALAAAWNEPDAVRLPLSFLIQPPAVRRRFCEVQIHASRPRSDRCSIVWKGSLPGPVCTTVLRSGARHLRMLSVVPRLSTSRQSTLADLAYEMFAFASHGLTDRGLSIHDVVRTWIYLRDIERDYAAFNEGRRRFFQTTGIVRFPASTGIEAGLADSNSPLAMDLYAVGPGGEADIDAMNPAPMGEARAYGSFFARGTLLRQAGQRLAFVSGTASIDLQGRIVAPGDAKGQLRCMLANAAGVLEQAGLGLADAVSVTTYLRRASSLSEFRRAAQAAGLPASVPTAIVVADICRPEWLCEIELVAGPAPGGRGRRTMGRRTRKPTPTGGATA
jgi:enamine deaminase RidA (YjgF/YER057c/UK114 family)